MQWSGYRPLHLASQIVRADPEAILPECDHEGGPGPRRNVYRTKKAVRLLSTPEKGGSEVVSMAERLSVHRLGDWESLAAKRLL